MNLYQSAEMTFYELGDCAMIVMDTNYLRGRGEVTPRPTPANFGALNKVILELLFRHSDLDPLNHLQHYKFASPENKTS